MKLKLINNTKVDHPTTGTKDLADSVAGATFMAIDNFITDAEIDIEVLYWDDSREAEDEDDVVNRIVPGVKDRTKRDMPFDLSEWLEVV